MNKTELIEKISESLGINESDQKLFFEILLKRFAEMMTPGEFLAVTWLGKFEYRKSINKNENDLVVFVTNNNEELFFDIPQKIVENVPIDSYFSISIGKPVIPFKASGENDFFIPQSGDEINRLLELKVEKFIEESGKTEVEAELQKTSDINDIHFSFLNWKRSSNLNEEINQIEKELDDSINSESGGIEEQPDEIQESIELGSVLKEDLEKSENETPEAFTDEINENDYAEDLEEDLNELKEIDEPNEELKDDEKVENELIESTDEWVDNLIEEDKDTEELILDEEIQPPEIVSDEFVLSSSEDIKDEKPAYSVDKEKVVSNDSSAIDEAFKFAEEKKARIESYRKGSYGGFIFAGLIIIATAAVIYFSFYFTDRKENNVTLLNYNEPKEFKTVIKRSFEIPVSYPYQSKMFAETYNAINDEVLTPVTNETQTSEQNAEIVGNSNSKAPEIRFPLPSKRIKGYIYQYGDGTYAVQVSSWKSGTIALSEVQKYLDKGFNAFAEESGLDGKSYYKVRIGGFKSLNEAEDFSRK